MTRRARKLKKSFSFPRFHVAWGIPRRKEQRRWTCEDLRHPRHQGFGCRPYLRHRCRRKIEKEGCDNEDESVRNTIDEIPEGNASHNTRRWPNAAPWNQSWGFRILAILLNQLQKDPNLLDLSSTHISGPSLKTTVEARPAGAGAKAEAPVTQRAAKATVNFILGYWSVW